MITQERELFAEGSRLQLSLAYFQGLLDRSLEVTQISINDKFSMRRELAEGSQAAGVTTAVWLFSSLSLMPAAGLAGTVVGKMS